MLEIPLLVEDLKLRRMTDAEKLSAAQITDGTFGITEPTTIAETHEHCLKSVSEL